MTRLFLLALALAAPATALAERYRVDAIVFIDRSAPANESTLALQLPNVVKAYEPYETTQLRAAGIEMLPDEQFGLVDAWNHLRNSKNHQPILRLAWLQKDPPAERGPSIRLHWGNPFTEVSQLKSMLVYPVDGSVTLLAGRFLHLDAELIYTQELNGELRSFRLKERRRLRRDELHHLDSPRIGIVARATRAEPKEPKSETKTAPKPAPKKR